jgi:hypothetical protein
MGFFRSALPADFVRALLLCVLASVFERAFLFFEILPADLERALLLCELLADFALLRELSADFERALFLFDKLSAGFERVFLLVDALRADSERALALVVEADFEAVLLGLPFLTEDVATFFLELAAFAVLPVDFTAEAFFLPVEAFAAGLAVVLFFEVFKLSTPPVLRLLVVIENLQSIKMHFFPKR